MSDYYEIIEAEFGDEQTRAKENMHAFYALCDFLLTTATDQERKLGALSVVNAMQSTLDRTAAKIVES